MVNLREKAQVSKNEEASPCPLMSFDVGWFGVFVCVWGVCISIGIFLELGIWLFQNVLFSFNNSGVKNRVFVAKYGKNGPVRVLVESRHFHSLVCNFKPKMTMTTSAHFSYKNTWILKAPTFLNYPSLMFIVTWWSPSSINVWGLTYQMQNRSLHYFGVRQLVPISKPLGAFGRDRFSKYCRYLRIANH